MLKKNKKLIKISSALMAGPFFLTPALFSISCSTSTASLKSIKMNFDLCNFENKTLAYKYIADIYNSNNLQDNIIPSKYLIPRIINDYNKILFDNFKPNDNTLIKSIRLIENQSNKKTISLIITQDNLEIFEIILEKINYFETDVLSPSNGVILSSKENKWPELFNSNNNLTPFFYKDILLKKLGILNYSTIDNHVKLNASVFSDTITFDFYYNGSNIGNIKVNYLTRNIVKSTSNILIKNIDFNFELNQYNINATNVNDYINLINLITSDSIDFSKNVMTKDASFYDLKDMFFTYPEYLPSNLFSLWTIFNSEIFKIDDLIKLDINRYAYDYIFEFLNNNNLTPFSSNVFYSSDISFLDNKINGYIYFKILNNTNKSVVVPNLYKLLKASNFEQYFKDILIEPNEAIEYYIDFNNASIIPYFNDTNIDKSKIPISYVFKNTTITQLKSSNNLINYYLQLDKNLNTGLLIFDKSKILNKQIINSNNNYSLFSVRNEIFNVWNKFSSTNINSSLLDDIRNSFTNQFNNINNHINTISGIASAMSNDNEILENVFNDLSTFIPQLYILLDDILSLFLPKNSPIFKLLNIKPLIYKNNKDLMIVNNYDNVSFGQAVFNFISGLLKTKNSYGSTYLISDLLYDHINDLILILHSLPDAFSILEIKNYENMTSTIDAINSYLIDNFYNPDLTKKNKNDMVFVVNGLSSLITTLSNILLNSMSPKTAEYIIGNNGLIMNLSSNKNSFMEFLSENMGSNILPLLYDLLTKFNPDTNTHSTNPIYYNLVDFLLILTNSNQSNPDYNFIKSPLANLKKVSDNQYVIISMLLNIFIPNKKLSTMIGQILYELFGLVYEINNPYKSENSNVYNKLTSIKEWTNSDVKIINNSNNNDNIVYNSANNTLSGNTSFKIIFNSSIKINANNLINIIKILANNNVIPSSISSLINLLFSKTSITTDNGKIKNYWLSINQSSLPKIKNPNWIDVELNFNNSPLLASINKNKKSLEWKTILKPKIKINKIGNILPLSNIVAPFVDKFINDMLSNNINLSILESHNSSIFRGFYFENIIDKNLNIINFIFNNKNNILSSSPELNKVINDLNLQLKSFLTWKQVPNGFSPVIDPASINKIVTNFNQNIGWLIKSGFINSEIVKLLSILNYGYWSEPFNIDTNIVVPKKEITIQPTFSFINPITYYDGINKPTLINGFKFNIKITDNNVQINVNLI